MKKLFGVLFILAGIALGLYVGGYLLFIGGIIDFVDGVKAEPVDSELVAWGVGKIVFASLIGWGIFLACSGIGVALLQSNDYPKRNRPGGNRTSRDIEREWARMSRENADPDYDN